MTADKVECRSDHAYIGYPVAFNWHGQRVEVTEVLVENRHPDSYTFRVLTEGFGIFELNFDIIADQWSVRQI